MTLQELFERAREIEVPYIVLAEYQSLTSKMEAYDLMTKYVIPLSEVFRQHKVQPLFPVENLSDKYPFPIQRYGLLQIPETVKILCFSRFVPEDKKGTGNGPCGRYLGVQR